MENSVMVREAATGWTSCKGEPVKGNARDSNEEEMNDRASGFCHAVSCCGEVCANTGLELQTVHLYELIRTPLPPILVFVAVCA